MYIYIYIYLAFLGGLMVLVFDPLKPYGGPFLHFLHPSRRHHFCLPEAFSHLLPKSTTAGAGALLGLGGGEWVGVVVPLISPRCSIRVV
ncbi:hypothetical protein LOK49_LG04G02011 [Camellia lanceoleosa]|uniref:Uncharacterized protein n=1 Tax=Camellia lanceoleosa TaxID=1840588 RepID=A0ACC0HUH5_9ERIC|nr:hypothetical protein LOK49_LG04G02011 [Camellia lanceoleosa]